LILVAYRRSKIPNINEHIQIKLFGKIAIEIIEIPAKANPILV